MKRKIIAFITAFALIFTTAFAVSQVDSSAAVIKPTAIVGLTTTSDTVDIKGKVTVKVASVLPEKASKSVKWKSSNTKIATVSSSGTVYGKKSGTVTITATSKYSSKVKQTIDITVQDFKADSITLAKNPIELYVKQKSQTISATLGPVGVYNKGLTWSRIAGSKSTIKYSGYSTGVKVTPLSVGKVTLKAKSKDDPDVFVDCDVFVKKMALESTKHKILRIGAGTYTNRAIITPAAATLKAVKYSSSNSKIAYVNPDTGEVTAKGLGTAKITAKAADNTKVTASYYVTVKKSEIYYDTFRDEGNVVNCKYDLNSSICSKYQVLGNRDATNESIQYIIDEDAVKNAFGEDSVNVWDRSSVDSGFLQSSFKFVTGSYEVSKAKKDGVRLRYKLDDGTKVSSYWYYRPGESLSAPELVASEPVGPDSVDPESVDLESVDPESVDPESVDPESVDPESVDPQPVYSKNYTLTLFSKKTGTSAKTLKVKMKDNVITFVINGKNVRITNTEGNSLNLYVTEKNMPAMDFTFEKNGNEGYKLLVPKEYVQKYELHIFLWEKK